MTKPILEVDALKKRFRKDRYAVNDISFQVEKGEIFGLLGHNGAGKSTTLGMILGLVHPDAGEVRISGVSVQANRNLALQKVGAIFESPVFYDYMSGWENLKYFAGLSGVRDPQILREAVEIAGLTDRIHHRVGTYSHGMRQRLGVAQALVPWPEILLLDEPTDGLDPEGIKEFRDLILSLRKDRGLTVLFNSHLLSEVEQMCDRVAILKQGQLVKVDAVESLTYQTPRFQVELSSVQKAKELLESSKGYEVIWHDQDVVEIPDWIDPASVVEFWVNGGIQIRNFARLKHSLEDVYLSISSPS